MTATVPEAICTFMVVSRSVFLRMKNISDKRRTENQTYFMFRNFPPPPENLTVCEIMWKNMVQPDRARMTI